MDRAVYVGVKPGNRNYLLQQGYVRALEALGWKVEWLAPEEGSAADLSAHDVIIWNGGIPEPALRRIHRNQILVAMNGAGDDLSHYARHADRIRLATSSFDYRDDPATNLTRAHFSLRALSPQLFFVVRDALRFLRFARPRFFRAMGVPFMHLPFASDPALFHPLPARRRRHRWIFCGMLLGRKLVPKLVRFSQARGLSFHLVAPELGNTVDPLDLNVLYNEATLGVNEQHLMTFGRELNQRSFDYGMAGRPQLSDMGYLAAPLLGDSCHCYAGRIASGDDHEYALRLVEEVQESQPEAIHEHFGRHHSFLARLAAVSVASGVDLTRGRVDLAPFRPVVNGWMSYRDRGSLQAPST